MDDGISVFPEVQAFHFGEVSGYQPLYFGEFFRQFQALKHPVDGIKIFTYIFNKKNRSLVFAFQIGGVDAV